MLLKLTIDLARLARHRNQLNELAQVRHRADVTLASVIGFVGGVVSGALLQVQFGLWSLTFPVLLAALSIPLGESWAPKETATRSE